MSEAASFADGGPIRARWLDPKAAREEVVRFGRRFGPEAFLLATHVALPLVLTPELVHLIRVNFLGAYGVPAVAEVDLLLSPLCRPLDEPLYEMEPQVRDVLLETLREEFGDVRLAELVEFLLAYRREMPEAETSADEAEAHKWVTDAWLEPADTMENLAESLETGGAETPLARAQRLRVAVLAETLASVLAAKEAERVEEFLRRSRERAAELLEGGGGRSKGGSTDGRTGGVGEGETDFIPGQTIQIPIEAFGVNLEFAYIPPGEFWMGSPEGELGRYDDESPRHRVRLTRDFFMQTTPVTQSQWEAVTRENPSHFKKAGPHAPVEKVSWEDVQKFIETLNSKTDAYRFRLPTEAEWEYACRAGTETAFYNGPITEPSGHDSNLDKVGWYTKNSGGKTHSVGQKEPNAWGLYDMHGNVYEWCSDWFDSKYYAKSPADDPQGPESGAGQVVRGGAWSSDARFCRAAYRNVVTPEYRNSRHGFRLLAERQVRRFKSSSS
jgi:formylglycine-generating enzyme required for sulfatase activity